VTDYDVVTMGRSSIDLYSNEIGAPFPEIKTFSAFVGGCPTNIAVGTRRLGLRTALLTAVGDDPVGDFVLAFLKREGVETTFIPRKAGRRTSAVLLGIEPPDRFPLVFYRDNCADIALDVVDVAAAPIDRVRFLVVTGTGLSKEPSRTATIGATVGARKGETKVVLDLDFRLDQWESVSAYASAIAAILPNVHIVIGTEEEIKAASGMGQARVTDAQVSSPEVIGRLEDAVPQLLHTSVEALVIKRGPKGSEVRLAGGGIASAGPFVVDVVNVLGAGDAFAAGFLFGRCQGWDWQKSARMGNATGAIMVTKHGCANFMPTEKEALAFVDSQGGF